MADFNKIRLFTQVFVGNCHGPVIVALIDHLNADFLPGRNIFLDLEQVFRRKGFTIE